MPGKSFPIKDLGIINSCLANSSSVNVYVVVNFLSQIIFLFLLFLGMVMYANAVETKEK